MYLLSLGMDHDPFLQGPIVGDEIIHTNISLPNVEKTIGAVVGNYMTHLFYLKKSWQDVMYKKITS